MMSLRNLIDQRIDRLYRQRHSILILLQVLWIALANQGAFWLRFDGVVPVEQQPYVWNLLPLVVALRLSVFVSMRLHLGVWRYASIWDLRNIVFGVTVSSALLYTVIHGLLGLAAYPRSVFIIDAVLLIMLMGGARLANRLYASGHGAPTGRRILIYGAGDAGEMIARDMRQNQRFGAQPVGFVDDDVRKKGEQIHGIRVFGTSEDLPAILESTQAEEMLIAMPSASPNDLRTIVHRLRPFKVRISTLPRLWDLVGKELSVGQIRQLKVEDLLAREPIALNDDLVRKALGDKRVLVTGAGGSIGSELCRQIASALPAELMLLDRYENSLYSIDQELSKAHPNLAIRPIIGDITDERRIEQLFSRLRPQVVLHAAAHKHVPLMEQHPCEAVKNNVRGTRTVAEASIRHNVERFVMVSTDKAVNPTSVMGAAKRVAELIVTSLNGQERTEFLVVRFGNVLASNGSVVPTFLSQIERGGPVTVTHPDMRRYFMLIPEAVQLVLQAAAVGERGSIAVLDMGEQVRVVDMARDVIRLAGFIPDKDIEIVYTGVRPGEKLYEELVGAEECAAPSSVPKLLRITTTSTTLSSATLRGLLGVLEQAALDGDEESVIENLCRIVPKFTPLTRSSYSLS
jgi:FlaA1/EpsC-like NDP-sugar epimerase